MTNFVRDSEYVIEWVKRYEDDPGEQESHPLYQQFYEFYLDSGELPVNIAKNKSDSEDIADWMYDKILHDYRKYLK